MEYALNNSKEEVKQSEFQRLYESLREEITIANELTTKVGNLSNTLKQIERNKPEHDTSPPLPPDPQGIIELFWEQVWEIRRSNAEMKIIVNHLNSII